MTGDRGGDAGEALPDAGQIAIVGMSGRFPGAKDVDALWDLVASGENSFYKYKLDELEDSFTDEERALPNFVPARPALADVDMFDADFFGMFPKEAAVTDPQHRIFLEICWEALEDAAYDPAKYEGLIGVFAGASMPTYLINNVLRDRQTAEEMTSNYQIGFYQQIVGSLTDALATRVAYKLDLQGPALSLQSACSTSLLAVSQACQNLLTYSCDMALAGGVSVTLPQKRGYMYQEGGMVSPDGVCRPFDADAAGTVFASGAGVVALKRLEDALRDGDRVYAVIRGYAVNNDGSEKVGFTAPSIAGQANVISAAIANAGVEPETIGYIECHGTATPLGDPIEFGGLSEAFSSISGRRPQCGAELRQGHGRPYGCGCRCLRPDQDGAGAEECQAPGHAELPFAEPAHRPSQQPLLHPQRNGRLAGLRYAAPRRCQRLRRRRHQYSRRAPGSACRCRSGGGPGAVHRAALGSHA
ncbi:acyl transferase domain-containing protein [Rhizobium sp. OAE497]